MHARTMHPGIRRGNKPHSKVKGLLSVHKLYKSYVLFSYTEIPSMQLVNITRWPFTVCISWSSEEPWANQFDAWSGKLWKLFHKFLLNSDINPCLEALTSINGKVSDASKKAEVVAQLSSPQRDSESMGVHTGVFISRLLYILQN